MNIFISYTIRDGILNAPLLEMLSRGLQHVGTVFVDLLHNTSYRPQEECLRRLAEADVVILCWTPRVLTSPWVREELRIAKRHGTPIVVVDASRLRE